MSLYQLGVDDPKVEVVLERSGRILRVEDYSFRSDFMASVDSFSFTYYSDDRSLLSGLELQPVTLYINDRPQIVGRIEKTTRGSTGSAVHCEGRDYIADLVESNIDPKVIFKDGLTLEETVLFACAPCGIMSVEGPWDRLGKRTGKPQPKRTKTGRVAKNQKDLKPEAGKGIYETISPILARFGLLLQPHTRRDAVVVQEPTYDQDSLGRLVRRDASPLKNSILSGEASRDYSSIPTHCVFTGKQGAPVEIGGVKGGLTRWDMYEVLESFPDELRETVRSAIVSGRREPGTTEALTPGLLYRLLYFRDDQIGKTSEQISNAMLRAIADRLKETLRYSCTVRGHTNPVTGWTYTNDILVDVDDIMTDVNEQLWVHAVTFSGSRREGPTTRLEMIRPRSFMVYSED